MTEFQQVNYVYVVTRRDLSNSQQAVQAAHAAIEVARTSIPPSMEHPHLVLCGVDSESQLNTIAKKLRNHGIDIKEWYEADRNDELTAIASEPVSGETRRLFKNLTLLKLHTPIEVCA